MAKDGCPRCGAGFWRLEEGRSVRHTCSACGYVPAAVHTNKRLEAELRAQAAYEKPKPLELGLSSLDERNIEGLVSS